MEWLRKIRLKQTSLVFLACLAGMLLPAYSGWLAFSAKMLLTYMLDTARILSHIPHLFAKGLGLPGWQLIILYGILAGLVLYSGKKRITYIGAILTQNMLNCRI
jgi:hypothetical protein